ncbi:response regulator transcription factor [Desulfuromonas sp. AOP6]|uniref:response regulator transcription factor n=1 Tax=Desulfuromonas sp. AOP6 TaxID=1566351 RepID=UPI0012763386|nr:response regulator transcription factor [Desulfuromonas sp. AOP6]BCA81137.1 hypothetical protein AOP6_2924 [Desulfuromonas sp. AOP6]
MNSSTDSRHCTTCQHRDRPIVIVGNRRFATDIFSHFIASQTPAQWNVVPFLQDIPPLSVENAPVMPRLIFFDAAGGAGSDLLTQLRKDAPSFLQNETLVLFNLMRNEAPVSELLELGVRGFFFEDDRAESILKGICALKRGEIWASREVMMEYVSRRTQVSHPQKNTAAILTPRERDVLALLAAGADNETICTRLYISPHTVKTHLYNIFKKIGARNRLQAALWAAHHLK